MTNQEKAIAVQEMNEARKAYKNARANLGFINQQLGILCHRLDQPLGEFYHNDYQTQKRAAFGEMNRARARLKRAVRQVEAFVKQPQAKAPYTVGQPHPSTRVTKLTDLLSFPAHG